MANNFFENRPIFSMVSAIIIVIGGYLSLRELPVEEYPDITPPVVMVSADYRGASAEVVDNSVATPIAQSIMGVDNLMYLQSTSTQNGTMSIQATFDIGSSPDMNTIFTENRVSTATPTLPTIVTQQGVTTSKTMNNFIMVLSLYSTEGYDGSFLTNYAYINIQNELLKINGVGSVSIMGAGNYSMRIWIEPDKLNYLNLSIADITSAIETQSGVYPVGKLGGAPAPASTQFTYHVVLPPAISTPEEYAKIIVKTESDGSQIKLSDVARVEFGAETYDVNSLYNNSPSSIIMIYQAPGSNALEVAAKVKSTMETLSQKFTAGIQYDIVVDSTTVITESITDITTTLLIALLLVVIIIFLFLQDLRSMIIPLVAIPVSLIGTFILIYVAGFSINTFTMLGLVLAIGLVVDDAIVVVEAVQVNIERGLSAKAATVEAMRVVRGPIIATTIVLASVFIPVSFMGGITGLMFQQFAITITFAVIISAFNALTLSPALCSIWLKKRDVTTKGFFGWFNRGFSSGVDGYLSKSAILMRHAKRSFILIAALALGVFAIGKYMPTGLLPEEDQGYVMTSISLPESASLSRTIAAVNQATEILRKEKFVQSTASASGFNLLSNVISSNSAIIFIKLVDYKDRNMNATEIASYLNGVLYMELESCSAFTFGPPPIPGLGQSSGFTMMLLDKGGNTPIYISDMAQKFIAEASKRPEIGQIYTEFSTGTPERKVTIDENLAFSEGVNIEEIHQLLATFLGGSYVNNFNRFGKVYQTYIQAEAEYRQQKSDLDSYFLLNNKGQSVPLSTFVTLTDTTGVEYLTQFNLFRAVTIMGSPAKGYSSNQATAALASVADEFLPNNMSYAWSGMSYQEMSANSSAATTYLIALLFVFLVLAALYESWTLPFAILLGVPFAVFGALLFTLFAHLVNPLYINDIFFQVSIILLIGLSAKNAILIIEYAINKFEGGATLKDAALEAAKLRVRPIIMTACAFILGVSPLILAGGANSQAHHIMGIALVGGMLVATILGLFIYPTLYVVIGKWGKLEQKRAAKQSER